MYKATNRRAKDDLDFDAALPILTDKSRRWLEAARRNWCRAITGSSG